MGYIGDDIGAKLRATLNFAQQHRTMGYSTFWFMVLSLIAISSFTGTASAEEMRREKASAYAPVSHAGCTLPALDKANSGDVSALREVVLRLVGPALPPPEASLLGNTFERYEKDFLTFAERHWQADKAGWEAANYYDRAKIFYVWWARTGDGRFLQRANDLALDYRRNYIEENGYHPSAHWSQMAGLALHCLISGDTKSGEAISRVADLFAIPHNIAILSDLSDEMDNRVQARTLEALLLAWQLGVPSLGIPDMQPDGSDWGIPGGNDWASKLRLALDQIVASQSPDGAYRFQQEQCGHNKPFMVGLLNDALIQYHDNFEADSRILPLIKRSLDYLWEKDWDAKAQAFVYLDGPCGDNETGPAPDLNNLVLSGFGWVYRETGDPVYRDRGDAVLTGAVKGAWLAGSKQFNQGYTSSYKYAAFRQQADRERQ